MPRSQQAKEVIKNFNFSDFNKEHYKQHKHGISALRGFVTNYEGFRVKCIPNAKVNRTGNSEIIAETIGKITFSYGIGIWENDWGCRRFNVTESFTFELYI